MNDSNNVTESGRPVRVLIVDDAPASQRRMAQLLGKDGYELMFVPNGRAASEKAMHEPPAPWRISWTVPSGWGCIAANRTCCPARQSQSRSRCPVD